MTEDDQIVTTEWMRKQEEARERAISDRAQLAAKVDVLAEKVDVLTASNKRTEEWLRDYHDTLTSVADGVRSLEKLGAMAERVSKVIKPIFWVIVTGAAILTWGKQIVANAVAHVRL